jgi:hypothetical protein
VITRYATVHRRGRGPFARALRQVANEIGWSSDPQAHRE